MEDRREGQDLGTDKRVQGKGPHNRPRGAGRRSSCSTTDQGGQKGVAVKWTMEDRRKGIGAWHVDRQGGGGRDRLQSSDNARQVGGEWRLNRTLRVDRSGRSMEHGGQKGWSRGMHKDIGGQGEGE